MADETLERSLLTVYLHVTRDLWRKALEETKHIGDVPLRKNVS